MSPDGGAMSPDELKGADPNDADLAGRIPTVRTDWTAPAPAPAREWLIPEWLPASRVCLLSGPGAVGKIAPGAATCRGGRVRCSGMVPLDWNWPLRSRRLSLPSVAGRHCVA